MGAPKIKQRFYILIYEKLYKELATQAHLTLETILSRNVRVQPSCIEPYMPAQIQEIKDEMIVHLNTKYNANYSAVDMEYLGFDGDVDSLTKFEDRKKRSPTVLVYHHVACSDKFDLRLAEEYINGQDVKVIRYCPDENMRWNLCVEQHKRSKDLTDIVYDEFNICNDRPGQGRRRTPDMELYKNRAIPFRVRTSMDSFFEMKNKYKEIMGRDFNGAPLPRINTGGNYTVINADFFVDTVGAADIFQAEIRKRNQWNRE